MKRSENYWKTREYLRDGLSAGDRLPGEREIAARLGLGRAALRSALSQLEAEGLLMRRPQSGTFLTALPPPLARGARISLIAPLEGSENETEQTWLKRVISALKQTVQSSGAELSLLDQSPRASDHCSVKDMAQEAADSGAQAVIFLHPLGTRVKIAHALALLHDQGVHPLIISTRTYPGLASQVYFDSEWGAYVAVRHLLRLGHQRIGFAGASRGHEWVQERLYGYQNVLQAADIDARDEWAWLPDAGERLAQREDGADALEQWLALPKEKRPTAIFAANDIVALGIMEAAQARGIDVPEEFSVIGFDNDPAAQAVGLTTIERPAETLGEAAGRTILERLAAGREAETLTVRLRPNLIERSTAGPTGPDYQHKKPRNEF